VDASNSATSFCKANLESQTEEVQHCVAEECWPLSHNIQLFLPFKKKKSPALFIWKWTTYTEKKLRGKSLIKHTCFQSCPVPQTLYRKSCVEFGWTVLQQS